MRKRARTRVQPEAPRLYAPQPPPPVEMGDKPLPKDEAEGCGPRGVAVIDFYI